MKLFQPILAGATPTERIVACAGVFAAIALTAAAGYVFPTPSPLVVAPIGASAVLVFVVPASPLAQPWPVIGGNVISALVGLAVGWAVPDLTIAAALAVVLAIAIMSLTRSLHPPGGAVALTAVLGVAFHALVRRSYPHRPPQIGTVAPQAALPAMFSAPDIDEALAQMGESFDIAREDLDRLLQYAEASAMRRQARSS
ncbi:CBS domain-containing membrane protein [Bosea sp. CRIB-10]|uniref:HPP family protein n=1 Tax=Bosea sp. CRIB-10 TaxID=378404 RepID=UPI0008E60871|nr:HPP family protein [Bosea sp. CRIB-10]SFD34787.1 CBS domain-containing membrane protein [Bosea sp. CRIB-10]